MNKAKQTVLQKYCIHCEPGPTSKAESNDGWNWITCSMNYV